MPGKRRLGKDGKDNPMNAALLAGALSGVAGLLTFLIIHHFWIRPIWFILPVGLLIAALGGLAAGWAYLEIRPGLPPRPWTVLAMIALIAAILAPSILLAQLRPPPLDIRTGAIIDGSSGPVVIMRVVLELLVTATVVGGLIGWWLGRSPQAAFATAVAGFVFALGPGHNIPLLGNTPVVIKGIMLLAAIVAVSSLVLVEGEAWLAQHN
jgi:hypothetical protein